MAGGDVVGHGISPFVFLTDGRDILVVDIHHHGDVIAGLDLFVDILGNQFRGKVARSPAHPIDGGIQYQRPFGLDLSQHLGVGKGQLHVVVAVESQQDIRMHIFINQVKPVGNLVAVHASQGIHNIEGVRVQGVDLFHQLQ